MLNKMIEGLPEEMRRPLVLSAIEEMTSEEVGAVLGMSDAAVRGKVLRAKAELKRRFEAATGRREVRR